MLLKQDDKTQEVLRELQQEQQQKRDQARPALGSTKPDGPTPSALRKLTIYGNIAPILSSLTRNRRVHTGVDGAAMHSFLSTIEEVDEEDDGKDAFAYDDEVGDGHAVDAGHTGTESE